MKNIFYVLLFIYAHSSYGQTYISGNSVVTFNSIASSPYLAANGRIDVNQGYSQQKILQPGLHKYGGGPTGEFWMHDGMLINLASRTYDSPGKKLNLEQERLGSHPEINYAQGSIADRSILLDYFNEIKSVNNFEVLVKYFKSKNYKSFVIQDNRGRYIIRGEIHCQPADRAKSQHFINTLLQSITFD